MSSSTASSSNGVGGAGSLHPSPGLVLLQSCWEIPYIAHFTWLFQQPLRMSPIPPETLERLLLHGCEEGREPVSQQMRELMTKLAISRRSSTDARLVAQLKKGEACGWRHIHDIVKQRLDTWWHEWREDEEEDEQREEGDDEQSEEAANGSHDKDDKGEDEEDNRPLPGQSHDYTGPDFTTFALSCPLPASFTFFSLSLHQRVVLLRCFCDDLLAFAADFATTVRGVEATDARIPPLGSDSSGHRYFFFGFPDWRIYREDNAKPIKPRELKTDRVKREKAEAERGRRGKKEEKGNGEEMGDEDDEEEEEEVERKDRQAATGKKSKTGSTNAKGRRGKDATEGEEMSAISTPSSRSDDEDDSASSHTRSASTSPRFQLLTSSPATLLDLITALRRSAYSKDKALSKQLQPVHSDLQQGKGRKDDSDEQPDEASSEGQRKRRRKEWAGGEVAKRSMRLMLVMAEKEEQERQQRLQAEEQRKRMEQRKDESIAQFAELYLQRHGKANNSRRKR